MIIFKNKSVGDECGNGQVGWSASSFLQQILHVVRLVPIRAFKKYTHTHTWPCWRCKREQQWTVYWKGIKIKPPGAALDGCALETTSCHLPNSDADESVAHQSAIGQRQRYASARADGKQTNSKNNNKMQRNIAHIVLSVISFRPKTMDDVVFGRQLGWRWRNGNCLVRSSGAQASRRSESCGPRVGLWEWGSFVYSLQTATSYVFHTCYTKQMGVWEFEKSAPIHR